MNVSPRSSSTIAEPIGAAERDLRARISELEQAISARDAFIAVAAHELRNPMTPILGEVELLLAGIRTARYSPAQVEQRLKRLHHAVQRYIKRATVLLNVTRLNSDMFQLEHEPLDLGLLLREVAGELADAARHAGVPLTVSAPEHLPGVWDRLALEQIIENLVSNAIKYGGRTPVKISADAQGEIVRIRVRDHGSGIPMDERKRVFQRFERAVGREEHTGFGVGLWVVSELVRVMGGSVAVGDAPGGGALFTVVLPRKVKEPSP